MQISQDLTYWYPSLGVWVTGATEIRNNQKTPVLDIPRAVCPPSAVILLSPDAINLLRETTPLA